jgi:RES domain-containing protein
VEGEDYETEMAHPPNRMVPTAELSTDGRVSPRGIPCLYLASNMKTAVAEVRPWVGSYVSLAQFRIVTRCKIVDGRSTKSEKLDKDQARIWSDIAYAFSKPVSPEEPHLEYVPTQILAETFRSEGFDGILYESLLSKGTSIALFDTASAELMNCGLHKVRTVSFEFDLSDNPYFMTKHYPEIAGRLSAPSEGSGEQEVTERVEDASASTPSL